MLQPPSRRNLLDLLLAVARDGRLAVVVERWSGLLNILNDLLVRRLRVLGAGGSAIGLGERGCLLLATTSSLRV
jgi:hypothetical protein